MKINKKAYINNFHAISSAGNSAEELFESICEKKDCISIDNTYVKDRDVAIGKIKSDKSFKSLLLEGCKKVLDENGFPYHEIEVGPKTVKKIMKLLGKSK